MSRVNSKSLLLFLCLLLGLHPARAQEALPGEEGEEAMGPQILHIPLLERKAEQGILRPVPLLVDLPGRVAREARRVLVHYRLWGDPDWTTLELRRIGARYEGAVPCLEISTVTGNLRYYIRVHDAEGKVIATGASRASPYVVAIKHEDQLDSDAPRAVKCPDPADCPRGLPGCPSEKVIQVACHSDADCEGGATCGWRGYCEKISRKRHWISLGISQEGGVFSTTGACSIPSQENEGHACYRADGQPYMGDPILTNEGVGAGFGNTRIFASYEHVIYYDLSLGVRLGWAIAGEGPTARAGTPFVPILAEARISHYFGDDVFAHSGFRPYAFLMGGYAMSDIGTSVRVRENPLVAPFQQENDLEQELSLYKRAGDARIGAGGGLAFSMGEKSAVFFEVAAAMAFPFAAFLIVPCAGAQYGF